MTPEERFERIEATLARAASLQHQINVRHSGIRGLYKQRVHRIEELADKQEHIDNLLIAVMDSALRTEESVRTLRSELTEFNQQLRTEFAEFRQELRSDFAEFGQHMRADLNASHERTEEAVRKLAETVERYIENSRK